MTGREFFCVERLRTDTFVTEQKITLPEEDDTDLRAIQVFLLNENSSDALATCRIFPVAPKIWQLGRVCTAKAARGQHLASRMMKEVHEYLKERGVYELNCHAQCQAQKFYEKLGYQTRGDVFDEGGMPHIEMFIKL